MDTKKTYVCEQGILEKQHQYQSLGPQRTDKSNEQSSSFLFVFFNKHTLWKFLLNQWLILL